jgi:hypothetical protein
MIAGIHVLEFTFITLLALMVVVTGVFGAFVVARVVEPRGVAALLRKITGRA